MVQVGTERRARCKLCSKLLSITGNSTLVRHQKSCVSKQAPPESSQAQISGAGQIWTYDQMRQRELQAQFVIKRGLPFSVFDNDDATEYIHGGLQPKYQKGRTGPARPGPINEKARLGPVRAGPIGLFASKHSSGPMRLRSSLTEDGIDLWRKNYGLPVDLEVRIPRAEERVQNPPRGWLTICEIFLRSGFRFPPCEGVIEILRFCAACLLGLLKGFENKTYKEIQEEALESKRQDLAVLEANGGIWPGVRTPSHVLFL
ncbi:hypothetical protein KSP39_PZI017140 [Platanthera zijinensis]|uniref:Uncharacterized protein n=1 Tax=Platanthera zijinensis TaxID=2320716 RepID=A0AAP0B611_9ASPA